jgi:hypothetical protein
VIDDLDVLLLPVETITHEGPAEGTTERRVPVMRRMKSCDCKIRDTSSATDIRNANAVDD